MAPLGMDTLLLMGMVVLQGSWWILTPTPTEQPSEKGEDKDDESNGESDSELSWPSAIASASAVTLVAPKCKSKIQELRVEVWQLQEG